MIFGTCKLGLHTARSGVMQILSKSYHNKHLTGQMAPLRINTTDALKCTNALLFNSATFITRGSATAEEPRDSLCQLKYYGRFLTELLTRSSANAQEPREHTVSWNRVKCHTNVRWVAFENVCKRWMTFKVVQGHCRCQRLIGHILFHISLPL